MQQIIRHIFMIFAVVLVAQAFVPGMRHSGICFDPIDANDYAVIKEKKSSATALQQNQSQFVKEIASTSSDHHHKKIKLKHVSFQFVLNNSDKTIFSIAGVDDTHRAQKPERYRHLFYRDINPPPRC